MAMFGENAFYLPLKRVETKVDKGQGRTEDEVWILVRVDRQNLGGTSWHGKRGSGVQNVQEMRR